jgi:hypothetical protein
MTEPVRESTWDGLIAASRESPETVGIRLPLGQSTDGLAGSFPALGTDGRRWWVKPPRYDGRDAALVTEFVVGRLGSKIGAPTCRNSVVEITADFAGWEYARGSVLSPGLGHGTEEVQAAIEERPNLRHRNEDDNRSRHARIFALYDWCWGSDQQWLHSTTNENATYSHDHGMFLPPAGWTWTAEALRAHVDDPRQLMQPTDGLRREDLWAAADDLDKIDKATLLAVLRQVPREWPVSDAALETLGWFLERRATAVSMRMRELV